MAFIRRRNLFRKRRAAARRMVSKLGDFHRALPGTMKLKLKAVDSNLGVLGLGAYGLSGAYGPATSSRMLYELFYPRGTYFTFAGAQPYSHTNTNGVNYPYGSAGAKNSTELSLFPDQMLPFAYLYKYARVEKVEFHFKTVNLGISSMNPSLGNSSLLTDPRFVSGTLNHTSVLLPYEQYATSLTTWGSYSKQSDTNAAQLMEYPGTSRLTSSQDGNREIISFSKVFDLTEKMAGDSIRSSTWMTSAETFTSAATAWVIPFAGQKDPTLVNFVTSPIIDEFLQTNGPVGLVAGDVSPFPLTQKENNVWLRYNEQVVVHYHITFWEPRTPPVVFA